MPSQPPASDDLPTYLADGVPKQDDKNLRALQDVAAEAIEASDREAIQAVEESSDGTVVIKKVSCGKDNCACQSGQLHGPYKYVVRRQGDGLDWEYKGPVDES
jgi:hypothetical protein